MRFRRLLVLTNIFPDEKNDYIGGIFIKEQLKFLKDYFETVDVVVSTPYGTEFLRGVKYVQYKFDNVQVRFVRHINIPYLSFRVPLIQQFLRRLTVILERNAVMRCIRRNGINPDLIHAHFTWRAGATGAEIKNELKVPLVITEHTSGIFYSAIESRDPLYINAWNASDAIIRVRQDLDSFEKVGVDREKAFYVPNGFDYGKFFPMDQRACRTQSGLPVDGKIVLTVGGLTEVKGHRFLIEAIRQIINRGEDILCVIVGKGRLERRLRKQIADSRLEERILLVGGRPHNEIPLWINSCDLFVLSSLTEGNPTVMFEALACGKPFVGTRVGAIPEIISSSAVGYVCNPTDPNDLAEKIITALHDQWDSNVIRQHVSSFTWKSIAERTVAVYSTIE